MAFFGRMRKVLKPAIDIPRWMAYRQLKEVSRSIFTLSKSAFLSTQSHRQESFNQVIDRLQLTPADLSQRQKDWMWLMRIWLFTSFCFFVYVVYSFVYYAWLAILPAFALSVGSLMQAFRYHFWLFQLRQRKLGCTFNDWYVAHFKKLRQSL